MIPTLYSLNDHGISASLINANAIFVVKTLKKAGFEAYLVGGCIRDLLLNEKPKDFDISTSAKPEEIASLFKNSILIGRRFRLAHIRFSQQIIEVSTFRAGEPIEEEIITKDNIWGSPSEDVIRRDFTINGLFYDPFKEVIIDYTGGFIDLKNRLLKTIGNPNLRFKQDPVRMIRLLKILARFNFDVDKLTLDALTSSKEEIMKSSKARVFEEIIKMLTSGSATRFILLLEQYGLLDLLFSDLQKNISQYPDLIVNIKKYLTALDGIIKHHPQIDRSVSLATLLFPYITIKIKEQSDLSSANLGTLFEFIYNCLKNFFINSFTGCPKKLLTNVLLILQLQYKLTPLNPKKKTRISPKIMQQAFWKNALLLLKIRSQVYPKLFKIYNYWRHINKESKKRNNSSKIA